MMILTGGMFLGVALVLWTGLLVLWIKELGLMQGGLAALCRLGWMGAVFSAFFPETLSEQTSRSLVQQPIHILLDDSKSMMLPKVQNEVKTVQKLVEQTCLEYGCAPKISLLSNLHPETALGFTPLSSVFEPWLYKLGTDPWILISDGGDYRPNMAWNPKLHNTGEKTADLATNRGFILGFPEEQVTNIWIEDEQVPPLAFEGKPVPISLGLRRTAMNLDLTRVQVQILSREHLLATANAEFPKGAVHTSVTVTVPPLARGQHLLTLRTLPTPDEKVLWDNQSYANVDVLPNTLGVLHLLGSPSWDGRFMRRFLKSEPKFDLISFFILRDPWDSQQVPERELSLIPFPVERLFRDELQNFRVVIIQNFTLYQFLMPEFQDNLVKFVKDGGGLLFIGGPRALTETDFRSSPLREILPFKTPLKADAAAPPTLLPGDDESSFGSTYDALIKYKMDLADPEPHQRSLANVYDDWEQLGVALTSLDSLQGLHKISKDQLDVKNTTPLLSARTRDGNLIPLAVASYPGKGRAIWLFSDSLWRLAMSATEQNSRQIYHQFMDAALTWLMRQDLKKPLLARHFAIFERPRQGSTWRVFLQGPAARYIQNGKEWRVSVCGLQQNMDAINIEGVASDEWELRGPLNAQVRGGDICDFVIEGQNPAFGSVKATAALAVPKTLTDDQMGSSLLKLEQLSRLTGAILSVGEKDHHTLESWLQKISKSEGIALPSRFKTIQESYWILDKMWFWLLALLLPLEVLVRRWHLLASGKI